MRTTIAICTWKRPALLARTLDSIVGLRDPQGAEWSVLVINNGCDDATDEVCRRFAQQLRLEVFREPKQGLSNARNAGVSVVRDGYILWTDDDVLVYPDWLTQFVDCARRFPEAVVFGGPIEPWFPREPDALLAQAFPLLASGFCGTLVDLPEGPCNGDVTIFGANMAFRAEALAGLSFNPSLGPSGAFQGGNDEAAVIATIRQRNGIVVWCPGMKVRHYVDPERMTLGYLTQFYTDRTRTHVRRFGVPSGAQIFGAPIWAWRNLLQNGAKYRLLRLTPFRLTALNALREYCRARGVVVEARTLQRCNGQIIPEAEGTQ